MKKTNMIFTKTIIGMGLATSIVVGAGSLYAQSVYTSSNGTMYSVPAGYQQYNYGTYYNSSTGMYYNPTTGQMSQTAPTGPATTTAGGGYSIPAGYTSSSYGTYYNASTGMYYDPVTGFTSSSAPSGPTFYAQTMAQSTTTATTTGTTGTVTTPTTPTTVDPLLPNTGTGAEGQMNLMLLVLSGLVAAAGTLFLARRARSTA